MNTPDRSSSSSSRIVQDVWDIYRDELGVVPPGVVIALRDAVFSGRIVGLVAPLRLTQARWEALLRF